MKTQSLTPELLQIAETVESAQGAVAAKLPYETPKLAIYGRVEKITLQTGVAGECNPGDEC